MRTRIWNDIPLYAAAASPLHFRTRRVAQGIFAKRESKPRARQAIPQDIEPTSGRNGAKIMERVTKVHKMVALWLSGECDTPPSGVATAAFAHEDDLLAKSMWEYCAACGTGTSLQRGVIVRPVTCMYEGLYSKIAKQSCALTRRQLTVEGSVHTLIEVVFAGHTAVDKITQC